MTSRTKGALAAGAAASAVVAAIALLWLGDGGPRTAAGGFAPEASPVAAAAPVVASAPAAPGAGAPPVDPAAPALPEWKDVRVSARFADLGPALARDVYDGLARAREAMAGCFADAAREDAQRPAGARPQTDEMGPPILTLQLESGQGELVIVAAPLQELGSGSMKLVDCCEAVLRGYRIPARNAVPGKRYRLQHALM
jgi:hypothetical protein